MEPSDPRSALAWDELTEADRSVALDVIEELLTKLTSVAKIARSPLSERELMYLQQPVPDADELRADLLERHDPVEARERFDFIFGTMDATVNHTVVIIRGAILAESRIVPTIKLETGLRLPRWWAGDLIALQDSHCPLLIRFALESAVYVNRFAQEKRPWRGKSLSK